LFFYGEKYRSLMKLPAPFFKSRRTVRALLKSATAFACAAMLLLQRAEASDEILRIDGAASVAVAIFPCVQVLRAEQGMEIDIAANSGNAGGIEALGKGEADMAMSSRPVSPEDRAANPSATFRSTYIGHQAIALVVGKEVHEGGVKALAPGQVRAIYEGRAKNWKEFGGPDLAIKFFNPAPGRGVWEMFAEWVYGDNRRAGIGKADQVRNHDEALNALAFTKGTLTVLPPALIPKDEAFPVAVVEKDGTTVEPTPQNIVSGKYSMARPLILVTNDRPVGFGKKLIDFLLSTRGQEMLRTQGYMTREQAKQAGGNDLLSSASE
jgi:phosphate transport system substrate-binding protein